MLAEPLVQGTTWSSLGGVDNDVVSANRYMGRQKVVVPAFPAGVTAAQVHSDVTQAGALGDPFGSGLRTVWWVYGVGPVKILFRHAGGETSESELLSTNLVPLARPRDANLLPLRPGESSRFRWRNSVHMKRWSTQRSEVAKVVNNTARVDVAHVSGPIKVDGELRVRQPPERADHVSPRPPAARTSRRCRRSARATAPRAARHFYTPFDLMTYGFNPVIPAYPPRGDSGALARHARLGVCGVTGAHARARHRTSACRRPLQDAVAVRSTLRQTGHPFGSGTRTSYFAPGTGSCKLGVPARDGSVSTVERVG